MNNARRNRGFSLVEVMCAILILGVALVGLTTGITTALSSNKDSEVQTTAAMIAAGQIEMIRADDEVSDGEDEGDCAEQGLPMYRWRQTVSSGSIAGLHKVKVVVQNAATGKDVYELQTMLFDASSVDLNTREASKRKNSTKSRGRERALP
jgi:prepilin-type N-terminal cleavage/methylation domain-containing protein